MKFILGLCIVALIVVGGMAVWDAIHGDTSDDPSYYPKSSIDFVRTRGRFD